MIGHITNFERQTVLRDDSLFDLEKSGFDRPTILRFAVESENRPSVRVLVKTSRQVKKLLVSVSKIDRHFIQPTIEVGASAHGQSKRFDVPTFFSEPSGDGLELGRVHGGIGEMLDAVTLPIDVPL